MTSTKIINRLLFLVFLLFEALFAQRLTVVEGNVIVNGESITHNHADSQAAFSDDGEWVVFVRSTRNKNPYGSIYKVRPRPGATPTLLLKPSLPYGSGFANPILLARQNKLIALAYWASTWDMLIDHDLRTGKTSVLNERVVSVDYIMGGQYDSCLVYTTRTLDLQYPMWLRCRGGGPKRWADEGIGLPFVNAIIAAGGRPLLSYLYE